MSSRLGCEAASTSWPSLHHGDELAQQRPSPPFRSRTVGGTVLDGPCETNVVSWVASRVATPYNLGYHLPANDGQNVRYPSRAPTDIGAICRRITSPSHLSREAVQYKKTAFIATAFIASGTSMRSRSCQLQTASLPPDCATCFGWKLWLSPSSRRRPPWPRPAPRPGVRPLSLDVRRSRPCLDSTEAVLSTRLDPLPRDP
jgi:hypothetical protein